MPDRKLRAALRFGPQDRRDIADELYAAKVDTYRETLADLATSYGYELTEAGITLAPDVERALRDEAVSAAASIVQTYNDELDSFLERQGDRTPDEVLTDYEAWSTDRSAHKSEQIAITEAYGPYTDATLAFFEENGLAPEFDFGGHGDDDPVCDVCRVLAETSPHPYDRVLEVGKPHIGCRQNWHPTIDAAELPDELFLGGRTAGVVGADALVNALGSHAAAVARIEQLAAEPPAE